MSRVAIVAAMEREVRPLVKLWRVGEKEHGGRRFRFFEEGDVVLVCGGIGAEPARRAAEAVIAIYAPSVVYSVGFAGALALGTKVGTVVQPAQVINAGDGSRVSLSGGNGILVSFGSVATPVQKAKLRESFGAQFVDMEAAAVARAAQARGVEFAVVKAISDEFDFTFPSMERFMDSDGGFHQARFAAFAAMRPWLWPQVWKLAHSSKLASRALCEWLAASIKRMTACAPDQKLEAIHRP
jgi:adenosylhomocysteine nucleosidase